MLILCFRAILAWFFIDLCTNFTRNYILRDLGDQSSVTTNQPKFFDDLTTALESLFVISSDNNHRRFKRSHRETGRRRPRHTAGVVDSFRTRPTPWMADSRHRRSVRRCYNDVGTSTGGCRCSWHWIVGSHAGHVVVESYCSDFSLR